ncbi:MAG: transporter substrate-binding domain-containing protein [Syntrophobacteraceae bacterium]
MERTLFRFLRSWTCASLLVCFAVAVCHAVQIEEIKQRGVLIHLGVPYANFVTGSGDGLDVELIKLFAQHLGVEYQYFETSWADAIGDLCGKEATAESQKVQARGDVIANGFTVIPKREKMVNFSIPTFPTQVWLIARSDSPIKPITPGDSIGKDIQMVRSLLGGHEVLVLKNTCLDPSLHNLEATGARVRCFPGSLNELAPAVINGEAETTILDLPDAFIALEKWPGKIKIIGPISEAQVMGCAIAKSSDELREAFNLFFEQCKRDGTYMRLVAKYYPRAPHYFPEFFRQIQER